MNGTVEIRLLGRFAVLRDGTEIPRAAFGGKKVRTLIKVLASRQGRFVSNDVLAEVLWPDRLPADPAANLQVLVNRARRALGDPALVATGQGGYSLAPDPAVVVDVERFVAAGDTLPELRAALALWQGDPLPEEAYDAWAEEPRSSWFQAHQQVLERTAEIALAVAEAGLAVQVAERAVQAEPLREVAVVLLMQAYAAVGDGAAALSTYDGYRRRLADELGVDPSAEAAALHRQLLDQLPPRQARAVSGGGRFVERIAELPFVGRDAEQAALRSACTESTGVVLLAGPSGSGKTRLLDELSRQVTMVRARAFRAERSEPWSLLRTLLREVIARDVGHLGALPRSMAQAIAWLVPELDVAQPATVDPESRRLLVLEGALRLLGGAGVAVVVDDLQWSDPSSLAALETVAARGAVGHLLLSYRPEELGSAGEVEEFLVRCAPVFRADLGGLEDSVLAAVIDDTALREVLVRLTDGTPLAVMEVLRSLADEGLLEFAADRRYRGVGLATTERAAALARDGQRRAIERRIGEQSESDRRVLSLLALMAAEVGPAMLTLAAGCSEEEVLDALTRLLGQGLVRCGERGWATGHDMVNEVVVSWLNAAERARAHADLVRGLTDSGDPLLVAHHLREAGDRGRAAQAFAEAARRASASFASQEAVRIASRGLEVAEVLTVRADLHEVRGLARQRVGELAGAREDLRAALAEQVPGASRVRVLSALAMLASGSDDMVRAGQLAELAVIEAGPDDKARARALEVAAVLDMNLGRAERASERADVALAAYQRLGDAGGAARILDARAMGQFLGGDVAGGGAALGRVADLFEDSGDLVRLVTPRSTTGHAAVFAGNPARGLLEIERALEVARALGDPEGQAYALWHQAEALAALGRGDDAEDAAAEALSIATSIGHRGWTATAWRAKGIAAQRRGDLDGALAAFQSSAEVAEHLDLFGCWAAARTALVLVELGHPGEALAAVDRALHQGPPLGQYEARWAQVEVAAAAGSPEMPGLAEVALAAMAEGGVRQGESRLQDLARRGARR